MKKLLALTLLILIVTACAPAPTSTPAPLPPSTLAPAQPTVSQPEPNPTTPATPADFFTQNGIILPAPTCTALTQQQTEGPYYTADTPQRNSLLEDGLEGTRLIVVGYVLDQNCQPIPNAWLDFWQANASGEYDNTGYTLRGHQFTDEQGRYYLETIVPGLYESRPIEHIHVKIKPEGGTEITSQLYFPQQPIDGLTLTIEERDGYWVGYFNFVVQR